MGTYFNIHSHRPTAGAATTIENLYQHFDQMQQGRSYSIGLHPWHLHDHRHHLELLREHAQAPTVKAIGECGLDKLASAPMHVQEKVFIEHIELANALEKPMIIHCVQAHEEIMRLFDTHRPQVPVVFHGYNKRHTIAEKLIARGYRLSFGAAILNENSAAAQVLSIIPARYIFLETDDADTTIEDIYQAAARLRNTDAESLILQLTHNYNDVFTS